MMKFVRNRVLIERRRTLGQFAKSRLRSNRSLWDELQSYLEKTESTGCSYIDYWYLYRSIRKYKPKEVLECGAGVSTLVIAHALMQNREEDGCVGSLTSMEESEAWLEMARNLLPQRYDDIVTHKLSARQEYSYSLFRGVCYSDVPQRDYDFVFVDGPDYKTLSDDVLTFDCDFLRVLEKSKVPVRGLVDKRVSTCFVLQQLLGVSRVKYSPVSHLGFIGLCAPGDLKQIDAETPSESFSDSFRAISRTKLVFDDD